MKMQGEQLIKAPRARVWAGLNDPDVLKQSITGCERIEKSDNNEFDATVVAKIGPVKAKFNGTVTLSDLKPPRSYKITGQGKGGAAGFAKGGANVELEETEDGTLLKYNADAQVGGKLAQIGSRLVDSAAKKMAADFFKKFDKVITSDIIIAGDKASTEGQETAPKKPVAKKAATKKTAAKKTAAKKTAASKTTAVAKKSATKKTATKKTAAKKTAATAKKSAPKKSVASNSASTSMAKPSSVTPMVQSASAPQKTPSPTTNTQPATPASSGNIMWWVIGGIILLVLLYILFA